jgi:hypothetical protein
MALLIMLVVGVALAIGLSGSKTAADGCGAHGPVTTYKVTIQNGKASQSHVRAQLCDVLTITNKDDVARELAFGVHDKHTVYDGISERLVSKGR